MDKFSSSEDGYKLEMDCFVFFFFKFLTDTCPFCFLGPLVPLFWISGDVSSGFQSQSGFCLICFFAEANVMCIPWDPPLVLHVLTSWWPAAQPVTSPHASAEVGLGLGLNGQSLGQKKNDLPLCQYFRGMLVLKRTMLNGFPGGELNLTCLCFSGGHWLPY